MGGSDKKITFEEIKVKGNQLVDKVKELVHEGNARRVTIRKDERTLMEFPLSMGVGGATAAIWLMPTLAAVGALAALVTDVDVIVERIDVPVVTAEGDGQPEENA